jgi:hypothetical protein
MTGQKRGRARRGEVDGRIHDRIRFHRTLLDLLCSNGEDLDKVLQRIRQLCPHVEYEIWEEKLAEHPPTNRQEIAGFLQSLGVIQQVPRKVRLKRVLGKMDGKFPVGTEKIGWEIEWPAPGKRYCLYMEGGRVFRTGKVEEFDVDHFRTGNSVYAIEAVE